MTTKTSVFPIIDSTGSRFNAVWVYDDDGQTCAVHSMSTEDHREIIKDGEKFFFKGTDTEIVLVNEPAHGPRSNVAKEWY